MGNNLCKVEKDLRSIAKRYKSVKYSLGLAILFLMLGVSAFSEEVNTEQMKVVPTREEIVSSKENIDGLHQQCLIDYSAEGLFFLIAGVIKIVSKWLMKYKSTKRKCLNTTKTRWRSQRYNNGFV